MPASATAVRLTWTANATNQTGYHLDRATDPAFTQNLITEVLPAAGAAFTDTAAGLVPGGTYYYRLRAYNSAGDSGGSNVAQVTIPVPPPTATNQQVTGVTATSISLSWQDNAGHQADGYRVLRAADHGAFVPVATLPPTSRTPPSTYEWTDENLTPATYYEYHVVAYNVSGNNDFAGTNATTLTLPPGSVTATPGFFVVNLAWAAPAGAVSFNVYRGTTPGGEDGTPIATGLTDPAYADTAVTPATTYYYTVTAVNANASHDPPLPAESAPSAEVSAAPVSIPAAPTGVTATSAFNTAAPGLTLTWDASAGADSYNVYRSTNASVEPATPVASGLDRHVVHRSERDLRDDLLLPGVGREPGRRGGAVGGGPGHPAVRRPRQLHQPDRRGGARLPRGRGGGLRRPRRRPRPTAGPATTRPGRSTGTRPARRTNCTTASTTRGRPPGTSPSRTGRTGSASWPATR